MLRSIDLLPVAFEAQIVWILKLFVEFGRLAFVDPIGVKFKARAFSPVKWKRSQTPTDQTSTNSAGYLI